jgi:hypothetical protein
MKSIKEAAEEWCCAHSNKGCTEQCDGCWQMIKGFGCEQHNMELAYEAGANYVIVEIENFMKDLDLGNSSKEKFYKLDVLANIHKFIEQLKSNQ